MASTKPFLQSIHVGEHALLEFEDPATRRDAIREWVRLGLAANERVLLVAHPDTPDALRQALATLDGFEAAVAKSQALIFPGKAFHESLGTPTSAQLESLHRKLTDEAKADGFAGVRACVDVTYYAEAGVSGGIERFEGAIGTRFPFAFRLLCLLDVSKLKEPAPHAHHTAGKVLRAA